MPTKGGIKAMKIYKVTDKLTAKQNLWIDEYIKTDDLTTASRNAGYKGNNNNLRHIGYENSIRFKEILSIRRQEINNKIEKATIATVKKVQEFWTEILQDEDIKMDNRIKASELLVKSQGGFVDKKEVKVVDTDWFKDD